ncbi:MAG: ABC transporter permease [Peptococcaceae bacterium]|nr:ABC transporter permease [Peptococcaceae bacterium]
MRLSTIIYYLREAFQSVLRNSWLSLASIGVVAVSMFILGSSLLLVFNANNIAYNLESEIEITLFLEDDTGRDQVALMEERLAARPEVAEVRFISKTQGLEDMKESFGENQAILEGLEEKNPLPDALRIKTHTVEQVMPLSQDIEATSQHVERVRYGQGVVEKLLALSKWVRSAGVVVMILLGAAAVFLVATTIRLSVFARRKEIGIMKTLGATNWFVRFPFLLEGLFLGLTGSLLAVVAVYFGYLSLVDRLQVSLPFFQLVSSKDVLIPLVEALIGLGLVIGVTGSMLSLRKFLKV